MPLSSPLYVLADVYGSCNYGSSSFNATGGNCGSTAGTGATSSSSGGLTNTGTAIYVVVVIACVLIIAGIVVGFWRRRSKASKDDTSV